MSPTIGPGATGERFTSRMVCHGCGYEAPFDEAQPFRCARSGSADDTDHLMTRVLDADLVEWPTGNDQHPFIRYRSLLHSYQWAIAHGMDDAAFVGLVRALDDAVAIVDGRRFTVTPFAHHDRLSRALAFETGAPDAEHPGVRGGIWVKHEGGLPGGSHKGRHLFGVMLHLLVARLAEAPGDAGNAMWPDNSQRLAIASCGNAALAAAVVARAAGAPLEVFIPTWADEGIVQRLDALGATITVCERKVGEPGDPCVHRFRDAVRRGAIPFTCQGNENGATIDGGRTLAYEIVDQGHDAGVVLDRIVVQVGGGALASALASGLDDAVALGRLPFVPKFHAVQTAGCAPLARAFDRADRFPLDHLARHRSRFMWAWDDPPNSAAHGILDDETYDWLAIVDAMRRSGGTPVVVPEATIMLAADLVGSETDATGAAGLAGVMALRADGAIADDERVVVFFTASAR